MSKRCLGQSWAIDLMPTLQCFSLVVFLGLVHPGAKLYDWVIENMSNKDYFNYIPPLLRYVFPPCPLHSPPATIEVDRK
jgi:hypothetical protein